ncbi:glycosyltransferase family 4 protein [Streptomyces sp. OE57]|uniref:glycosyltransferase family 4 protein n=1 Tax=Streptomyces lacaronensis TaxID=3379885 RepID=UPI0039B74C04
MLSIIARSLAAGVELAVLPVRFLNGHGWHQPRWHRVAQAQLADVPYHVYPLGDGNFGGQHFGSLATFRPLVADTASIVDQLASSHPQGALIAIDRLFSGLGPLLPNSLDWELLYLPRSTAAHHADPSEREWEQQGLDGWIKHGARVGAISVHMRAILASCGVPEERLLDVPGGLTPDDDIPLSAAPQLPLAARRGFLLAMGRAQPYKGWDDLLDALTLLRQRAVRLPHLLLAAVTNNNSQLSAYQRHLDDRIRKLGLDATLWPRYQHGLPGLLHDPRLRAVVIPSRIEPLGRIPLEAYVAGAAPVIATTAGGLSETVLDGVTGYTCRPGDPVDLAGAVQRALSAPSRTIDLFREAGARLAADRDYTTCITSVLRALAPWATEVGPADNYGAPCSPSPPSF